MSDTKTSVKRMVANSPCSTTMNRFKGVSEIGKGEHGTVYQACLNDACKRKFALKVSKDNLTAEHNLTKKFINLVGKNSAANVYALERCKNDDRLYSELLDGRTFGELLPKLKKDPKKIRSIVRQVLKILKTLHEKSPSFRHNDLHLGNIFVTTDGRVRIIDFGLSFNTSTKNPEINVRGEYLLPYGVYRGNNKMYDTHFFLNSLYNSEAYLDESTLKFIRDVLPGKYLGITGNRIYEARLKKPTYKNAEMNLPTFAKLFTHPYIKGTRATEAVSIGNLIPRRKTASKPIKKKAASPPPSTESMSAKMRKATEAFMKSKLTQKKRPGAAFKKTLTPKPAPKPTPKPNVKTLTKTRAKPLTMGKVSDAYVKDFMKNMARPKTNLRNRNI